jgi:ketosteroid isomerase-like protein
MAESDNVALARRFWEPFLNTADESAHSSDRQQQHRDVLDAFTEDVVCRVVCRDDTPVFGGERRGRQAVVDFFATDYAKAKEHNSLDRPAEFVAGGDRVVMLGAEGYTVTKSGAVVHNKEFAFVMDFRDGRIARLLLIEDLSEWNDAYRHPGWSAGVR